MGSRYIARAALRGAAQASRQRATSQAQAPVRRPAGVMSAGRAMTPEGRAEFRTAMRGRPAGSAELARRQPETVARPATGPQAAAVVKTAPIDGDRLLRQVYGYLGHMAVWPSQAAQITATLYAAACWARDDSTQLPVWQYMPRLFFTSKEGGSGKSRMSRLTAALCPGGKRLAEMTKASLIDLIAQRHTVVVTELDVTVGTGRRTQWLTGIANVGYEFDGATSRKQGGKVQEIPLFGPMILDGLDSVIHSTGVDLKTLMSRCIIVHVERAPEGYRAPRYDREKRAIAAAIGMRLARWMAQEVKDGIGDRVPEMPEHLGNRPHDLWEPLAAVAEAAGGDWPAFARYACEHIESSTGLPGDDERESDRIDGALEAWDAPAPVWPEGDE